MLKNISNRHIFTIMCIAVLSQLPVTRTNCQESIVIASEQILHLRDSLDAINYSIPQIPRIQGKKKVIKVKRYEEWKAIGTTLKDLLEAGHNNIILKVSCEVKPDDGQGLIQGLDYPEANIRIEGKRPRMGITGWSLLSTVSM